MASVTSITDGLPMGLLSNAAISGVTDAEKIKSCCKALEGLFAGQLLKEIGAGIDDGKDPTSGQYSDFIQQALAQQVSAGGGFGLAKMLENSLTPGHPHTPNAALTALKNVYAAH